MATEYTKNIAKKTVQKKAATNQNAPQNKTAERKNTAARNRPVAKQAPPRKKVVAKKAPVPSKETVTRAVRNVYTQEQRHKMISTMAYFLAEKRGFAPGKDGEDWLNSEKIINDLLKKQGIKLTG
jgi:hypothetical protein